jgi:hypothetical protein
MPCQHFGAAWRQSEVSAARDLEEAGLDEVSLGPVDPVCEYRLFATWQEFASFIVAQAELVREPGDAVSDARLPLRPEL